MKPQPLDLTPWRTLSLKLIFGSTALVTFWVLLSDLAPKLLFGDSTLTGLTARLHHWFLSAGLDQPALFAEFLRTSLWIALGAVAFLLVIGGTLLLHWRRERPKLREEQKLLAQYKTIFNNAMVGIVYLKQRRVVSCNRRFEEIFGYGPGELIGESSARFYESPETFDLIGKEAYRALGGNRNYSTEAIFQRKDGSPFPGALNGCVIDPDQPQEGSIWIYADISERCNAEQKANKLLQAVEQSPLSIIITNREGLIEYVNPRFSAITGYSLDEVLGQHPHIFNADETPSEIHDELWKTILAGKEWRGEKRRRRKNGEFFWEETTIAPIFDPKGEASHFVAIMEDITTRKTIKQQLEDQKGHLEELVNKRTSELSAALEVARLADQGKDAFLANMSHELRTPLNAVIGMANLARSISTESRQQNYLDKIVTSGKHLNRIVNDLLDLSKIAAGHLEFENINFSVRELIVGSNSVMAHRAASKGLKLTEFIDPAVPDTLIGDPARIEQILMNLISNAVKFTQQGGINVHVGLGARKEDKVCLEITVEDSGIGMRPEDMAHLFEPFAQADASISRKFGGTGLGLAISRRLTRMMGGDISLSSQEGMGSTFKVTLWLTLGNARDLRAAESTSQLADAAASPGTYENVRILVVEDQPLNREIVEALLAAVGITPDLAENGQEALDALSEAGPAAFDLVLMDVQMPVMDGLSATRIIRSKLEFNALPIIGMTAHTMAHEKLISAEAGMNDHIGKPFDNPSFYRTLARWIPAIKHKTVLAAEKAAPALVSAAPVIPEPIAPAPVPTMPRPPAPVPPAQPGTDLNSLVGIDVVNALARFNGKEDRYRHWLADFIATADKIPGNMHSEIANGHPDLAAKLAHSLKGRVGMLGMLEIHTVVAALEQHLRDGTPAADQLDELEYLIAQMRDQLAKVLLPPSPPGPPCPPTSLTIPGSETIALESVTWSDTYSVGVPEMDAQHKKLIGMINQLAACQRSSLSSPGVALLREAKQAFHSVLTDMFEYTQLHFKAEEAYLRKIDYPRIEAHESEHATFIEKMAELSLAAAEGSLDMSGVHQYLKDWLFGHILKSDMHYRQFVETSGN